MAFVHLHRHSEFSRLDGVGTAVQYAKRAAELGQPALAITDHGTLSGALHHIQACSGKDSKGNKLYEPVMPIIGVEAYFRPIRSNKITRQSWHLCLFAKNLRGWHNLLRLVSKSFAEIEDGGGFYQDPCVDYDLLKEHREGLFCSSACYQSWIAELIRGGDSVAVSSYVDAMLSIFGDDFALEIMPHDFDDQRSLNIELIGIAQERSIPLIATNDAHFPFKDWAETQRIAKLMGVKMSFKDVEAARKKGKDVYLADVTPNLYLAHEEEMRHWFSQYHPQVPEPIVDEAIENTGLIVQKRWKPYMLDKSNKLPKVTESPEESERILQEWIEEGFQKEISRWEEDGLTQSEIDERHYHYEQRITHEFEVLRNKGVLDYFVMIGDVVRWAKSQGIRVGLGRGSAAGSLVSYFIGVTAIDPIQYGLLFERFINPERKGMPDIDVDFQSDRRSEVKAYIASKFGEEYVADIITHARFQPKSVLQDLCRTYDIPYKEAHDVTDPIEIRQDDEETTLEEILPLYDTLAEFKEKYPEIWTHALRMEGTVRNAGKHAAGIVITPKPVIEYMALERGKKGDLVTSWSDSADFQAISENGFMKYDFLGIKGLQKHDYACKIIKEMHGIDVDLNELPALRDPKRVDEDVMEIFRSGMTTGVFQFGSRGITSLLRDIQPDNILDLAAANALYRPGPMKGGVTWDYAKRKNNPELVEFWHEILTPVLAETYGLIAYQEQVMKIVQFVGGFTGGEADDMRKAMGKLYRIKGGTAAKEFMKKYEQKWFAGAKKHNISDRLAKEIWNKLLEFGHYGFNKSHSAAYALQAYQDAWLKAKYPQAFYAAILSLPSGSSKNEKEAFQKRAIREARARGIEVLPPNVNSSREGWCADGEALRMGLLSIKGVGDVFAAQIIEQRKNGIYLSVEELRTRCPKLNKTAMEALAESGALDEFGARHGASGQQIAQWEKDRINVSLTNSGGAAKYADDVRENIYSQEEVEQAAKGEKVIVGGEILSINYKKTKNGKPFANVMLAFELNEWRLKFWSGALESFRHLLHEGNTIMVNGTKDEWSGSHSVIVQHAIDIESFAELLKSEEHVSSP